jgi:hypothetical protein
MLRSGILVGEQLTSEVMLTDDAQPYGLGVERGSFPGASLALGHVGAVPGYVALAFYLPGSNNFVVVATNTDVDDLYLVLVDLAELLASG